MRIALFSGASNAHSDASAYVSILKKAFPVQDTLFYWLPAIRKQMIVILKMILFLSRKGVFKLLWVFCKIEYAFSGLRYYGSISSQHYSRSNSR